MAFTQIHAMSKRRLALIVGAAAVLLGAIALAAVFVVSTQPRVATNLALPADIVAAITEASDSADEGDYNAALSRLDEAIASLAADGDVSKDDLYAEAKLKLQKADIIILGLDDLDSGYAALYDVYRDLRYPDTVGGEALMLAMGYAVQGIDEGWITAADVTDIVLDPERFGGVTGTVGVDKSEYDELWEIDFHLARGFNRAIELTESEKVVKLAQSYISRIAAPYMHPYAEPDWFELYIVDVDQLEAHLNQLADGLIEAGAPYENFVSLSLYNIIRAYEAMPPQIVSVPSQMALAYEALERYAKAYPNNAAEAEPYLVSAAARITCRAVDAANFNADSIDAAALQPLLDRVIENGTPVVPCPEAFEFVADEIDDRFAAYF